MAEASGFAQVQQQQQQLRAADNSEPLSPSAQPTGGGLTQSAIQGQGQGQNQAPLQSLVQQLLYLQLEYLLAQRSQV